MVQVWMSDAQVEVNWIGCRLGRERISSVVAREGLCMTPSKEFFQMVSVRGRDCCLLQSLCSGLLTSYLSTQLSCQSLSCFMLSKILQLQQQRWTGRRQLYVAFSVYGSSQCYSCWIFSFKVSHFLPLQDLVLLLYSGKTSCGKGE